MSKKNKAAKAKDISKETRDEVRARDGTCILCHKEGFPNAHVIRRTQGGLGNIYNVVTLCNTCHYHFDFNNSKELKQMIKEKLMNYIQDYYGLTRDELLDLAVYKKYI